MYGFRQGVITSGLNHLGNHLAEKSRIVNGLKKAGYKDPYAKADIESSELNPFAEKVLGNSMDKCDNPPLRLVDKLTNDDYAITGSENYGNTPMYSNDGGKTYHLSGVINISRIALKSWVVLASTIGHELNHYYHVYSGAYNRWIRKYDLEYAHARSEYISQHWEYRNGGIPTLSIMNENYLIMTSYHYQVK